MEDRPEYRDGGKDAPKLLMKGRDISLELWRNYRWRDPISGEFVAHRISKPFTLYYEQGHTTHRIVDEDGIVHCIPAPGYFGCVLTWQNPPETAPVSF